MSRVVEREHRIKLPYVFAVGVFAVSFYLAMFYSVGYSAGRSDQRQSQFRTHLAKESSDTIKRVCDQKNPTDQLECVRNVITAEYEENYNESNNKAQRDTAEWVRWTGIIAAVQTIISGLGLIALLTTIKQGHKALKSAQKANSIASRNSRLEMRAYIAFERIRLVPIIHPKSRKISRVRLLADFRNFGKTPATLTGGLLKIQAFPTNENSNNWDAEDINKINNYKSTSYPDKTFTIGDIDMDTIDISFLKGNYKKNTKIQVLSYVIYQDIFLETHHTREIIEISIRQNPEDIIIESHEDVKDIMDTLFVEISLETDVT